MTQLLRGPGHGDGEILQVVQPSAADLATRQAHFSPESQEGGGGSSCALPPVEEWRMTPTAGCVLNEASGQVVRSNHFLVNTRNIPPTFFHYDLSIQPYDFNGDLTEDSSKKEDYRVNVDLLSQLRDAHPEFEVVDGQRVGFVYDSRSCVVTTRALPLPDVSADDKACVSNELTLKNIDGSASRKRFLLTLTYATTVQAPPPTRQGWATNTDTSLIRSLDLSLLAFAREQLKDETPSWYLVGNKCFSQHAAQLSVAPAYVAMRGYTVGLKCCLAGLTLVSDMTVSVFLTGGPLMNVVAEVVGKHSVESFLDDARRRGVDKRDVPNIEKVLKNCKIRVDHLVRRF
jgi:hypothetical protein